MQECMYNSIQYLHSVSQKLYNQPVFHKKQAISVYEI